MGKIDMIMPTFSILALSKSPVEEVVPQKQISQTTPDLKLPEKHPEYQEDDEPIAIAKMRLAKGEITIEELKN